MEHFVTLLLHNIHPAASSVWPRLQGPGLCGLQLKHTHTQRTEEYMYSVILMQD